VESGKKKEEKEKGEALRARVSSLLRFLTLFQFSGARRGGKEKFFSPLLNSLLVKTIKNRGGGKKEEKGGASGKEEGP